MNVYDAVLYPTHSFVQTHPNRLATMATLFGMTPAPVERCRVLELGCSDGGNLIPMAFNLPESEFVGVDMASRPIAAGREIAEDLGLKNLRLHHMSIEDVPTDFRQFDYIISHGVYSWVPSAVRDKMMAICQAHLSPQGVAYISYNAYPGGHVRQMLREMMLFHTQNIDEPQEQMDQAIALLKFLAESQIEPDPYTILLKGELERVTKFGKEHLFHDDLAETNTPFYFYQFIKHAAQHGLQYLAEADFHEMQDRSFPSHVTETLNQLAGTPVLKEQYLDFLRCRVFRSTLLCRREVTLERVQRPEQMKVFYVASSLLPVSSKPDLKSRAIEEFRGVKEANLSTDHPLIKAAVMRLGEIWPQDMHFSELLAEARTRIGVEGDDKASFEEDSLLLGKVLLDAYAAGVIVLHLYSPKFVTKISEYPCASLLARVQLRHGTVVTNQRHFNVKFGDEIGRQLLQLLDGTRDRAALLNELTTLVEAGRIQVRKDGEIVTDTRQVLNSLPSELDQSLNELARYALLVA